MLKDTYFANNLKSRFMRDYIIAVTEDFAM